MKTVRRANFKADDLKYHPGEVSCPGEGDEGDGGVVMNKHLPEVLALHVKKLAAKISPYISYHMLVLSGKSATIHVKINSISSNFDDTLKCENSSLWNVDRTC